MTEHPGDNGCVMATHLPPPHHVQNPPAVVRSVGSFEARERGTLKVNGGGNTQPVNHRTQPTPVVVPTPGGAGTFQYGATSVPANNYRLNLGTDRLGGRLTAILPIAGQLPTAQEINNPASFQVERRAPNGLVQTSFPMVVTR